MSTRGGASLQSSTSTSTSTSRPSSSATALNSAVAETTEKSAPTEVFRSDYRPLTNIVSNLTMDFDIRDNLTLVTTEMTVVPNPNLKDGSGAVGDLELDGDETSVKLMSIRVDGRDLVDGVDYDLTPGKLLVRACALKEGKGLLRTVVEIVPEENTQLSGKIQCSGFILLLFCVVVVVVRSFVLSCFVLFHSLYWILSVGRGIYSL